MGTNGRTIAHGRRVALVTGASRGIGREVAAQLAAAGAVVLVGARRLEDGHAVAGALAAGGDAVEPLQLDVTDQSSVEAAAATVDRRFGRLDILVNNAGVMIDDLPPDQVTAAVLADTYAVNVVGVVRVMQAFIPLLRASGSARVVNLSSEAGSLTLTSTPAHPASRVGRLAYTSSKTALNALTVVYAGALAGDGVLVNAVCPGFVDTDLNGHRGTRTVPEGAGPVVALALAGAGAPTGSFSGSDGPIPW